MEERRVNRRPPDDKTHFIGVTLPTEIVSLVEEKRAWARGKYGCRSGHSTLPHITLVPPFSSRLPDRELLDILSGIVPLLTPFKADVQGYGSFSDRTVFLRVVESRDWSNLSRTITKGLKAMGVDVKEEKKSFTPHITIANRDIPPGKAMEMLSLLSEVDTSFTFTVDAISLFSRDGYSWKKREGNTLSLGL